MNFLCIDEPVLIRAIRATRAIRAVRAVRAARAVRGVRRYKISIRQTQGRPDTAPWGFCGDFCD